MKTSQIFINIFLIGAITLLLGQRFFLALTPPWVDFLLIGGSVLCLLIAFGIHCIAGADKGNSSPDDGDINKSN